MAPTVPIEFIGQKESKKCWLSQPMGKSRKYSRGHSTGFVPEYRHAVETMAESEGFGSSGRVDTEMTASDDSCAPKRKSISLNVDGYDCLGIPTQVLSMSKMSRFERKDLEFRLRKELEQVRILQRKVASLSSNPILLSPSSDIRSCSDGQKRPALEGVHGSFEVAVLRGKKRAAPSRNGARAKKGSSGRFEPAKSAVSAGISGAMLMKQCETLLNRLMSHQFGWVFNTPVDVVKLNIPDYFNVITHPMDLGTVKSRIASGEYSSPLGFAADVRLTFANAMKYNPPGNDVHFMAEALSKFFEVRWKAIEKKLPVRIDVESVPSRVDVHLEMEPTTRKERETGTIMPPSKKKKVAPSDNKVKSEPVRRVMNNEEKQKLSLELEALLGELPESIIEFLKEHSGNAGQTGEEEIEIDIDALSDDTLFNLRKLLDNYLLEKQRRQLRSEQCEMEIINEPGISNSSLQRKGKDTVDEDIDIVGGNDPPVSSYSPVNIETDAAHKNTKCSSLNRSSGESGSSSSDSDSGSESGGESDAVKASVPINVTEENKGSGENLDQKRSSLRGSDVGNKPVDGLSQVELDSERKPMAAEMDCRQDGESAPPERQVSPEKLYRAALLRNRFADTILKAREKALEKGEKRDPEKLRMEKEEFERKQKEEKARLQAEAKAAEEARRKAEAQAAAEAKRKRELEREAARQALLQMEKSVDINENSQFLEDLEIFRTTHDEQLSSFVEETSSDHSQNGLGSFKLKGSNPLEQLGLYMKEDEEEEDEVIEPPQSMLEPAKDVEEGEIEFGLGCFKIQGSNPMEQLGLYMKEDEEEEEVIEPPQSVPESDKFVEEGEIENGPGSLKLQDGRPLEQLGLCMKEEDDVVEQPQSFPEPAKDVEAGEIENGLGSSKLPGDNPVEQPRLYVKQDVEDDVVEAPQSVPEPAKDVEEGVIENGLGSFKLQDSNPLEQLGSYMREDEEEVVEPPESIPDPGKDVEADFENGSGSVKVQGCNSQEQINHLKGEEEDAAESPQSMPGPVKDDVEDVLNGSASVKRQSSNLLEQQNHTKVEKEAAVELPNLLEQQNHRKVEKEASVELPQSIRELVKDVQEGDTENGLGVQLRGINIPEQLKHMNKEKEDIVGLPQSAPDSVKGVHEGDID